MRDFVRDAIESASTVEIETLGIRRHRKRSFADVRAVVLAVVRELPDEMSVSELRDEIEISESQRSGG